MESYGERSKHSILCRSTQRDEKRMVVGLHGGTAALQVRRNGHRLFGDLEAPALRVVPRRGQEGLPHQVVRWGGRRIGRGRSPVSPCSSGAMVGVARRTSSQRRRGAAASGRKTQRLSGRSLGCADERLVRDLHVPTVTASAKPVGSSPPVSDGLPALRQREVMEGVWSGGWPVHSGGECAAFFCQNAIESIA